MENINKKDISESVTKSFITACAHAKEYFSPLELSSLSEQEIREKLKNIAEKMVDKLLC